MGLSTKNILAYKGAKVSGKVFSSVEGTETPNLDYLKSGLAQALNNIKGEQGNISSYITQQNSWKNRLIDLSKAYTDCADKNKRQAIISPLLGVVNAVINTAGKCRDAVQGEENIARQKVALFQGYIDSAKTRIKDAEQRRDFFQEKISKYQAAVQQAISIGVTDGGAVEIAELEVKKAEAELKSLQGKPMRTYFLIGGAVVLGVVGLLMFRKR